MGQYYVFANLDNGESTVPCCCDKGTEIVEGCCETLFAKIREGGPWAGHAVVVSGDYAKAESLRDRRRLHVGVHDPVRARSRASPAPPLVHAAALHDTQAAVG